MSLIAAALPWTIGLLTLALAISWTLGNLLGALAGYFRRTCCSSSPARP